MDDVNISNIGMKIQAAAWGLLFVLAVVLGPALLLAALLTGWARFQGWPATRLRNVAVVTTTATAVGVLWASAVTADWMAVPNMVGDAVMRAYAGDISWSANLGLLPWLELPIAAVIAWIGLHRRELAMEQEPALRRSQRFEERTKRNQRKAALRREKGELTPLSRGDRILIGPSYRREDRHVALAHDAVTARHSGSLEVPMKAVNEHLTLVGGTGSGKTELLHRLSAGWTDAAWRGYALTPGQGLAGPVTVNAASDARPLTIFVQAKGGRHAASDAFEWAQMMEALGLSPQRTGVWPFQDSLDMWRLPVDDLRECLHSLVGTDHHFYDSLQLALLSLVLDAPGRPAPRSSVDFLARVQPTWLRSAWQGHPAKVAELEHMVQAGTLMTDRILLAELFRTLGCDFDAGRSLQDFDALYVSLNGTSQARLASAKAKLLVHLLQHELASGRPRRMLFVFDEYSAVSEQVDVRQLVRTARSLGGSMVFSAQSYYGLGRNEGEIDEVLADMRGGHLVMAGQAMEPWSKICGTRKRREIGAQLDGAETTSLATMRLQDQFIISPDELKDLPEHHVAYIKPGSVELGKVVQVGRTQRGPLSAVADHPQRSVSTEGRAVSLPELEQGRASVLADAGGDRR